MLYATTSTGVFSYDIDKDRIDLVISNKHTPGFFRKRARGFFGICFHPGSDYIITASRERLGTRRRGKPATDTKLHLLDPISHKHRVIAEVYDVHDVHQIECYENFVYITDTGKNRVHVYDLLKGRVVLIVNVGEERDDVNHINALLVHDQELLIGLNNRGHKESQILHLPLQLLNSGRSSELDAYAHGRLSPVPGRRHTHDIRRWNGQLLLCASHDGAVIRRDGVGLAELGGWVRGLAPCAEGIWVGASELAPRSKRHSEKIDGRLVHFSKSLEIVRDIKLRGAGQVNDLCWVQDRGA